MLKRYLFSILAVASFAAGSVAAQDLDTYLGNPQLDDMQSEQSFQVPEGAYLVPLYRFYHRGANDRVTARELPYGWQEAGWRLEGQLGYISYYPFEGHHVLYSCQRSDIMPRQEKFSSPDPGCEGHNYYGGGYITGYVSSFHIPGTVMLYRCDTPRYGDDHFDTTDPNCEGKPGAILEGPLGYIFI